MKNSYSQIYNPKTKKYININSQLGQYIALRYFNKIGGGKTSPFDGPCPESSNFYCPISHAIMIDPVICCDGQTYERNHIQRWFAGCEASVAGTHHNPVYTSPMTMIPLANNNLISNIALRNAIEEYNRWVKEKETKKEVNEEIKNTKDNLDHLDDESKSNLVESSTTFPQASVESSTTLPEASVESYTTLPQASVESSTMLPQASVESSTTLPQGSVESSITLPSLDYDSSEEYDDPYQIFWDEIIRTAGEVDIHIPDDISSFTELIEILERIWFISKGPGPWLSIYDDIGREPYGDWEYVLLLMWNLNIIQNIHDSIFGRHSRRLPSHGRELNHMGMLTKIYYSYFNQSLSRRTPEVILKYFIYGAIS
tara:strand:- start:2084 stop:3193 length:1110 start_codon:yes stop_codon:yes gene_type:complete